MDFKKHIEEFKQFPEILSIVIIGDINSPQIDSFSKEGVNINKFTNWIIKKVKVNIYDQPINNFHFSDHKNTLLGYKEGNTLILLYFENTINLLELDQKIQNFLNDILIFS
ncbi:MAG: hypothetical protein ACTSR8_16815 [Promethearchaeota archaeon]